MGLTSIFDILLPIIYTAIILFFCFLHKKSKEKENPIYEYFLTGLNLKIIGSVIFTTVYLFYYGGTGDSITYYMCAKVMAQTFYDHPSIGIKILMLSPGEFNSDTWDYTNLIYFFNSNEGFFTSKIGAVFAIFSFNSIYTVNILVAVASYVGIWKAYQTFVIIYPDLYKKLAIAFLFIPSVFFWGSPLLKDTISLSCLGWIFYATYNIFILRKKILVNIFTLLLCSYLIFQLKAYILLCYMPFLGYWIYLKYQSSFKNVFFKITLLPMLFVVFVGGSYLLLSNLSTQSDKYSSEKLKEHAIGFQQDHGNVNREGTNSMYTLGEIDYSSPLGIASKIPAAINVTLFRPYLFEVRSPIMIMAALESTLILLFTFYILFIKVGLPNSLKIIKSNDEVIFCLLFSLTFAFAIGFTSYNFGALVRFKIPMMSFFVASIFIIERQFDKWKE